ncbi:MAG TPA: DUF2092 domain-containing protein [Caulobacteraceae bacterium]
MNRMGLIAGGLCLGFVIVTQSSGEPQMAASRSATAPATASQTTPPQKVDPDAVKALNEMSAYLKSLSSFELTSETSLDLVAADDQKIQLDGVAHYKVRKDPGAFVIDVASDDWNRRYIYNGAEFTLYAPKFGYYATVPAPATIEATVDDVAKRFGISLPLDDLFRWSGPGGARADTLDTGFLVGTATIGGVPTRHYAFREGDIDWQVWIQQGAQPLPLKLVIVNRRDATDPAYAARLTWTLNPPVTDEDFKFSPPADAKRIRMILEQLGGPS